MVGPFTKITRQPSASSVGVLHFGSFGGLCSMGLPSLSRTLFLGGLKT